MDWARTRFMMVLGTLVMVLAACGSGSTGSDVAVTQGQSGAPDGGAGATGSGDDGAVPAQTSDDSDVSTIGERSATISVDGDTLTYAFDDITFSTVEGVNDITFETCNPDFFGSGRFYAIGYAVDDAGEVIVDDDGNPASFTMDLPPDDWEATERDAPDFEIKANGLDIEIATPEQVAEMAPGGSMSWTVDDTSAVGTAVFVDFDNTYTVEFDIVCEGSPTVDAGDLPKDSGGDGGSGGFPLKGAGTGSITADGESFDGIDVYSCEPFSFGQAPNPKDLSLVALLGGSTGLEVEISHSDGVDFSNGNQFEQVNLNVFYSRQGESGLEQFEGSARTNAAGDWFVVDAETFEEIPLDGAPVTINGDRVTGGLAGLVQTWPDEGAATVDVTYDLEVPSEINTDC